MAAEPDVEGLVMLKPLQIIVRECAPQRPPRVRSHVCLLIARVYCILALRSDQ